MKAIELEKAFNPKEFEDRVYAAWQDAGLFKPLEDAARPAFTIVIPPPNVTGVLHMGHGLNNSIQDIIVRYQRMLGKRTLWVPGTDHAGIATQNVVEKRLKKEGKSRHDLGRDAFVELTWKVKAEHHAIISQQLKKIGSSCDWSRERFTMDEGLSKAVREVFVSLYERGLIYRGEYLVNWCPSCGTALADDEVEHSEESGFMYRLWYQLADGPCPACPEGRVEIATTRPETLLGDTAVAVHPEDDRYRDLVGRQLRLPLTDRLIPIIADTMVDREFGSGMVKITPAHDPNDFECGNRHGLARINILRPDGRLNDSVPEAYRGLDVKAARKAVLADLEKGGLLKGQDKLKHSVGHCYRCATVVEPFLSEQWFVRMRPLADKALGALADGSVRFFPQRWENTYTHWLNGIRDWCISRQLWWGHRIPVWYCADCGQVIVSREDPLSCPKCGAPPERLRQDPDVLDTWFSSWLWPFSVMGWPERTVDLETFYPTSALVTAYDIIFFWVARMIMAGMEFMGRAPFRDIYITSLVRDKQGRKMSKSLGNGIDPLEIVDQYGADALKFTIAFLTSQGQDVLVDKESFKLGSKFANKVWNATRYILLNLGGRRLRRVGQSELRPLDQWVYHRLNLACAAAAEGFRAYRFNDVAQVMYEFFWNDFCDWYVEGSKLASRDGDEAEKDRSASVLADVLVRSLVLLHPLLSFVTEEIYGHLKDCLPAELLPKPAHPSYGDPVLGGASAWLMTAAYPEPDPSLAAPEAESMVESLKELVRALRNLRAEFAIAPEKRINVSVRFEPGFENADFILSNADLLASLSSASGFNRVERRPDGCVALVCRGLEAYADVREAIDLSQLADRLEREMAKESQTAARVGEKLANPGFVSSAPAEVVAKEREKLEESSRRRDRLASYLEELRR